MPQRQSSSIRPAVWHHPQMNELIRQRKRRNRQYHDTDGTSHQEFWSLVARRTFVSIVMESLRDQEDNYGPVQAKDTMSNFKPDLGKTG
ncbi:hypothetical protein GLOIN_2v1789202 [Rhizophagus clarus]|uniref:Uncharacterized protein n=1 Tax=Rhizophagus clarus TaxID=94130 RepID=A0A8H3QFW9_9GLOM|nr:hypothetical protein GLOIN_2v1789202 [Rhizophagus clarus]